MNLRTITSSRIPAAASTLALLIVISCILVTGCTQQMAPPATEPTNEPTAIPTLQQAGVVQSVSSSLGMILADEHGKTLYVFDNDITGGGSSACTG
jgi:hypothetical protein